MRRRQFFQSLALTLASAVQSAPPPRTRRETYQVGCFTRPWDRFEVQVAFDGIAEAGFKYAGLMTAKGAAPALLTPETSEKTAAKLGGWARERGLETICVYSDFSVKESVAKGVRQLRRLIENTRTCEARHLILGGTHGPEEKRAYLEVIRQCGDFGIESDVVLSIKPHGGITATGAQCRELIEAVAHRNFRLWYDPGNILYYSKGELGPLQDVFDTDGLVIGMSVKDFRAPQEVAVTPGTGSVPFNVLFARLQLGGFRRGPLMVECTSPGPDGSAITREATRARRFAEQLTRSRGFQDLSAPPGVSTGHPPPPSRPRIRLPKGEGETPARGCQVLPATSKE